MAEQISSNRSITLRHTDEHFWVAVKPPFRRGSHDFHTLNSEADGVYYIEQAQSQVFMLPRRTFGDIDYDQEGEVLRFVDTVAKPLGIVLDVDIQPVALPKGSPSE